MRLVEDGSGTLLRYEAKADVGGKLAQLGGRLIDATARKLAGEFFRNFTMLVDPAPPEPAAPAPEAEADPAAGEPRKAGLLRRWLGRKGDAPGGSGPSA